MEFRLPADEKEYLHLFCQAPVKAARQHGIIRMPLIFETSIFPLTELILRGTFFMQDAFIYAAHKALRPLSGKTGLKYFSKKRKTN